MRGGGGWMRGSFVFTEGHASINGASTFCFVKLFLVWSAESFNM